MLTEQTSTPLRFCGWCLGTSQTLIVPVWVRGFYRCARFCRRVGVCGWIGGEGAEESVAAEDGDVVAVADTGAFVAGPRSPTLTR